MGVQGLRLKATVEEKQAACCVMDTYACYLNANVPWSAERAVVMAQLHHLHLRLLQLLPGDDGFITASLSLEEAVVLSHAVLMYQEILRVRPALLAASAQETLRLVNAMQQRCLEGR